MQEIFLNLLISRTAVSSSRYEIDLVGQIPTHAGAPPQESQDNVKTGTYTLNLEFFIIFIYAFLGLKQSFFLREQINSQSLQPLQEFESITNSLLSELFFNVSILFFEIIKYINVLYLLESLLS